MNKVKKTISILVLLVATFIMCVSPMKAIHHTQVPNNVGRTRLQNSISYIGGGKSPYTENGTTYYYSGNVIELTISLPANSYAIGLQEIVTYDLTQLELITSFSDIRQTVGQSFHNEGWSQDVMKFSGNNNQILVFATANDWTTSVNTTGGVVAKAKFRIKEQHVTSNAQHINLNFSYQIGGVTSTGQKTYIHEGYDAANDATTYMVSAPTISLAAHKTPTITNPTPPEIPESPSMDYQASIVIDKEISESKQKEIAAITSKRDYSFTKASDSVNGKNSYKDIANALIEKMVKAKDKVKYQSYEFNEQYMNVKAKKTTTVVTCYTHYIYIGMSFLVIFMTYGYKKYLEANRKVKWRS